MSDVTTRGALAHMWAARSRTAPSALAVPTASDRATWDLAQGTAHRETRTEIISRESGHRADPWPELRATAAMRYHRDGDREEYETALRARQLRLTRAAVAAASTLEESWIDEVANGLYLLCEQSTWCWPAHDDTRASTGAHLPNVDRPFLDLGAGEMAAQLAWTDHLLGEQLDVAAPGIRARLRREVRTRITSPFLERDDWHWLGTPEDVDNWNPWILGNVITAATQLEDDAETRRAIIGRAIAAIDTYVAALPFDGAIDEGYSYWWNGACRLLETIDFLDACWGGFDAGSMPALRATVDFPHRMHLGGDWFVTSGDGQARPPIDLPWHSLFAAARGMGADAARRFAVSRRPSSGVVATEREGLGRLVGALVDTEWAEASDGHPPLPRDVWLPSTQIWLARAAEGSAEGLTAVLKGGNNGEHHNHLDVGSVTVALDGVPVIVDPGRPTYTSLTFSPRRYEIWTMQSDWHSVPRIAGLAQGIGKSFAASGCRHAATAGAASCEFDLIRAYPESPVSRWRREVSLDRAQGTVRIVDAWETSAPAPDSLSRWMIAGEVEEGDGFARVSTASGTSVVLTWDDVAEASWETRELEDPMLEHVWGPSLSRLTLAIPHPKAGVGRAHDQREGGPMSGAETRSALAEARRNELLSILATEGVVRISDLADRLKVTPMTLRRDVNAMADQGLLRRVHGGAAAVGQEADVAEEPPATAHATPIGILVPSMDYYWPGVITGAEESAARLGIRLVLRGSSYEADDMQPQLERLLERNRVRGVVVAPNMAAAHTHEALEWLTQTGIPVVLGRALRQPWDRSTRRSSR